MTAFERVSRTKRSLGLIVGSSALFWGAAAGLGLWIVGALLASVVALPSLVLALLPIIAVVGGVATFGFLLWRGRFAWSFDKVALWIEERAPQLRYALVTAIDPRYKDMASIMEPVVAKVDTSPFVRDAAKKSTLPAFLAFAVAVVVLLVLPPNLTAGMKGIFPNLGDKNPAPIGNRLVPLVGTLTPPSYSGIPVQQLEEPASVSALQGSTLILTGKGSPEGIEVTKEIPGDSVITVPVPVTAGGNGWMVSFQITDSMPSMLRFRDRQYSRAPVIIIPIVDQPPTAKLLLPVRDTTLRLKDGRLPGSLNLSTDLRDDIGLASAYYEVIIAEGGAGGGQDANYEFRDTIIGRQSFNGSKTAKLEHSIPYSAFRLKEGNQLFVRAIVIDNNGYAKQPGRGYSETRTIRVATSGEYDTLNVNPAPPSADTALITLRMLIIATQKLDSNRHKMERKAFVDSAYKLGGASDKVRQTIMRIIDEQTGGGEIDADPRLTEAADSMWSAARELYIAQTWTALPAMKRAYKLIQDYTNTARYYLRGVLKPEPVNIDRVRLTGKDSAIAATERTPRPISDVDKARMAKQYAEAIRTLGKNKAAAVDQLTMLQVEALGKKYDGLATALGEALGAINQGKDASASLLKARRFLEGKSGILTSLPSWSGAW